MFQVKTYLQDDDEIFDQIAEQLSFNRALYCLLRSYRYNSIDADEVIKFIEDRDE